MKTNSAAIAKLELAARTIIPSFDWLKLGQINTINIEFPPDESPGIHLAVSTTHYLPSGDTEIALKFTNVRDLQFPKFSGYCTGFGELSVQDVSDQQLEGVRFFVKDYSNDLSLYCRDIKVSQTLQTPKLEDSK